MKKRISWVSMGVAALALQLCVSLSALAAAPPKEGEAWPAMRMSKPAPAAEVRYLGLKADAPDFTLDQVKAQVVLIEVFSMYCPICQAEAPRINQLQDMIKQRGLADKVKLLGLGAGNSEMEVEIFRSKFNASFAMVADADYVGHKALGEPRTPYFMLVRLEPGGGKIIYAKLGQIGEPGEFLNTILEKASLK